jgi:hypothetical protein
MAVGVDVIERAVGQRVNDARERDLDLPGQHPDPLDADLLGLSARLKQHRCPAASEPSAVSGMLVLGGCGYSVTSRTATRSRPAARHKAPRVARRHVVEVGQFPCAVRSVMNRPEIDRGV